MADDEEATRLAAGVMQQLWRPVPVAHPFPTVARWAAGLGRLRRRFDGSTGPLPAPLVEQAEALFADLLASAAGPVLLHGDLHHWNILAATRAPWLALDPKGVVGEPAYEVGALLRNRLPRRIETAAGRALLARRVAILSEALAIEPSRLLGWGVAVSVLSAWWSIEDHGSGGEAALACARVLAGLLDDL